MLPARERLDGSPKQNLGSFVAREMLCVPAAALPKQGSALKGSTAEEKGGTGTDGMAERGREHLLITALPA